MQPNDTNATNNTKTTGQLRFPDNLDDRIRNYFIESIPYYVNQTASSPMFNNAAMKVFNALDEVRAIGRQTYSGKHSREEVIPAEYLRQVKDGLYELWSNKAYALCSETSPGQVSVPHPDNLGDQGLRYLWRQQIADENNLDLVDDYELVANFLSNFINSTQSDVTAAFISYTTGTGYYSEILRTCAIGTFLQVSPEFSLFADGPVCETAGGWLYDGICISD